MLNSILRQLKGLDTKKQALGVTAGIAVGAAAVDRAVATVLLTGGSAAAAIVLHDATGATNATITLAANVGQSFAFEPATPIPFPSGIYAVVTGTGASALVVYS